jgi:hypothetical protein
LVRQSWARLALRYPIACNRAFVTAAEWQVLGTLTTLGAAGLPAIEL